MKWRASVALLLSLVGLDAFWRGSPARADLTEEKDYGLLVHSRGEPDGLLTLARAQPWPLPPQAVEVVIAWTQQAVQATGDALVKEHAELVERFLVAGRASYVPGALLACAGAARLHFDGLDPDSQ